MEKLFLTQEGLDYQKNFHKEIKDILLKKLDSSSNQAFILNDLGLISWEEGDANQAIHYFNKAFQLDSNSPAILINVADFLLQVDKTNEAKKIMKLFQALYQNNEYSHRFQSILDDDDATIFLGYNDHRLPLKQSELWSQRNDYFLKKFDQLFSFRLGKRAIGFKTIFDYLLSQQMDYYLIIETGSCRQENSWRHDGLSTVVFDHFVSDMGGKVISIDIDPVATNCTKRICSHHVEAICSDSIEFLWNYKPQKTINLVYLDSFDFDHTNYHPSAMHHIKELLAIISKLTPNTLIVVDDNFANNQGKGMYLDEFFAHTPCKKIIDGFQMGWILI